MQRAACPARQPASAQIVPGCVIQQKKAEAMLTMKYIDADGYERVSEAYDVRAKMDGRYTKSVGWRDERDTAHTLTGATTAYLMNDGGATIAKYVLQEAPVHAH